MTGRAAHGGAGGTTTVRGRLVLDDRVVAGEITVAGGLITAIETGTGGQGGPLIAPGFIDVHVHGWGGHSAMGGRAALDGMARALLRRGVTSFLPTAWTAPIDTLVEFGETVRAWLPGAPDDGAAPLGINLEGPFLAAARKGAHDPAHLRAPADVRPADLERLLEGVTLITVAPELPGALDLIRTVVGRGARVSLGHSAATLAEARAGYAAGASSTTHLFNAMTGVHHHSPGLAVAALGDDDVYVELIADGLHVDPALFPIIARSKPRDRLMLVSDGLSVAGSGAGRVRVDGMELDLQPDGRIVLAGTQTLAGGGTALGDAVGNLVGSRATLPAAIAAASTAPALMLGLTDRGRIAAGLRADLVELDDRLGVVRVMRRGTWLEAPSA